MQSPELWAINEKAPRLRGFLLLTALGDTHAQAPAQEFHQKRNSLTYAFANFFTAAAKRLLLREAVFLCTIFLSATLSITDCAVLKASAALALSPFSTALRTALMAVRIFDFMLELAAFSLTD
jgi:hypothetical protein